MVTPIQKISSESPELEMAYAFDRGASQATARLPFTPAEAELRAAIRAGNQHRAVRVLESAPYLRLHGSKPRPIEQAIDYWRMVCAE